MKKLILVFVLLTACDGQFESFEVDGGCEDTQKGYSTQVAQLAADEEACEVTLTECEDTLAMYSEAPQPDCSAAISALEVAQAQREGITERYNDLKQIISLAMTDPRFNEKCDNGEIAPWICEMMQ